MNTETERLERVRRSESNRVIRNLERGVLDADLHPFHQPCDYFALVAYEAILAVIGQTNPVDDEDDEASDEYLTARADENRRVAIYLRDSDAAKLIHGEGAKFGRYSIRWPDRIPRLKTWAGKQNLLNIITVRKNLIDPAAAITPLHTFFAPVGGASGIDAAAAPTSLEAGFSLTALKQAGALKTIGARIYIELLAIIGAEITPIVVYPDGCSFGYYASGRRWKFRMESRGDYYGRWGMAHPDD